MSADKHLTRPHSNRLEYLDGARGIAAFTVFISHLLDITPWHDTRFSKALEVIFNAGDAVPFFFVLSGFALSYKYLSKKPLVLELSLRSYVNSRLWRIYPALFATLIIYFYVANHQPGNNFFHELFDARDRLLNEALLIKNVTPSLNYADWSLEYEMAISMILPVLMLTIIHSRKWFFFIIAVYFIWAKLHGIFTFDFCLGIVAAYFYEDFRQIRFTMPKLWKWRWPILIISFTLSSFENLKAFLPALGDVLQRLSDYLLITEHTIAGVVSFFFLVYFLNSSRSQWLLSSKLIRYLGRISYSVYLIHVLYVYYLINPIEHFVITHLTTNHKEMFFWCFLICATGVIISASIIYYCIERPFMKIGKLYANRWLLIR